MRPIPLVVLALLVAGCVARGGEEEGATSAPAGREVPWQMLGCRFAVAILDAPASAVRPFVPEGFRVLPAAQVVVEAWTEEAPRTRADGNLGFEVFVCEEGAGLRGRIAPMTYASVFTAVEPPASMRQDVARHFVQWDVLVPDAERREALAAAGIPARDGNATIDMESLGRGATRHGAALAIEGLGAFAFEGRSVAPIADGEFVKLTPVRGGTVAWSMRYQMLTGGAGPQSVTIPDGAWFNAILPAGTHHGAGFSGVLDLPEGSIELP